MKKLLFILSLSTALILSGCGNTTNETSSADSTGDTQTSANSESDTSSEAITVEKARQIALSRAGVTDDDIRDYDVDFDSGRYEISFEAGGMDYEILVDATSGEVVGYQAEEDKSA